MKSTALDLILWNVLAPVLFKETESSDSVKYYEKHHKLLLVQQQVNRPNFSVNLSFMKQCEVKHEKILLYVFVHVFYVGMCAVLRLRHMGKPKFSNVLANQNIIAVIFQQTQHTPRNDRRQYQSPLTSPGFQTIFHRMTPGEWLCPNENYGHFVDRHFLNFQCLLYKSIQKRNCCNSWMHWSIATKLGKSAKLVKSLDVNPKNNSKFRHFFHCFIALHRSSFACLLF